MKQQKEVADKSSSSSRSVLIGKWFLSFPKNDKGEPTMKWQGVVIGSAQYGAFLVQLFSWLTGGPTNMALVTVDQMVQEGWQFYVDSDDMAAEAERQQQRAR